MLAAPCHVAAPELAFDVRVNRTVMKFIPLSLYEGFFQVSHCPKCGDLPDGIVARVCTASDCGLANRASSRTP